ncbi:ParB/RepB/Spo0J family partition protein [Aminicella lysinilytica]|uniref:ParB family chromosome partitioning protein n=1 Tax=Aminicella lysinilytica TaxID=433323 RepID=A0A4V3CR32_9FIRM|nr:ParB/RepB/Spo0J family partition protein [Aminicella lysinilytica]TDP53698.1 ParB family chromosome partitioning protein [Aminicella lysinilytica]
MAKKRRPIDFGIANPDDLFSTQEERDEAKLKKIYEVSLDEIDPFPEHPFKVKDDEDMMNLVESVKANGIITPATLRKKEDGRYEIISGHRRKRACELAGLTTLRSEVVDMTRDEATIFMVESNFQRTTILPSEKAFAYKMRLEAMNRQGQRSDLTCSPVGNKLEKSSEELSQQVGDSKSQIFRYIRLTELNPALLDLVDEGQIALRPAVELSYLPKEQQKDLCESIEMEQCTPTHAQAIRMRKMSEEGKLTPEAIEAIMLEEKPNQKERLVLRGDRFKELFPKDLPVSKREDFIAAAMEYYGRYLSRKDRENER